MIVAIEPLCCGIEHTPVNAAILRICRAAFPDRPIRFCAELTHLTEVQQLVGRSVCDTIDWAPITIPARQAGSRARFHLEYRLLRSQLEAAQAAGGYALLLSAVESTIFAVKALHTLWRHKTPVQAVLHGYLNAIAGWRSRNPLRRAFDLRSALSFGDDRYLRYVVLEPAIARRVGELLPALEASLDALPHPIPPEGAADPEIAAALPLNVSFLGLATPEKGFDLFVQAAESVLDRFPGRIRFHAIGRLGRGEPERTSKALSTSPQTEGLSRSDYLRALRDTHYVCLPFQGKHYELAASGVLLDAIAWCKPIIGMPSPTLQELFATHPDIGYLCRTPEELVAVLAELAQHFDEQRYRKQMQAMSEVRRSRLPETIARQYRTMTDVFLQRVRGL